MKLKLYRRLIPTVLSVGMIAGLLPVNVMAAQQITPVSSRGSSAQSLAVEYFPSTLYNWDEAKANSATQAIAVKTSYSEESVSLSSIATSNTSSGSANSTSYYHKVGNNYYPVYYSRSGSWRSGYSYTLYYSTDGQTATSFKTSTDDNERVTLYKSTGKTTDNGFYFTNSTKPSTAPAFSVWNNSADSDGTAYQQYMIYSGLAAADLSASSNAPFNDDTVTAAALFAVDGSNASYTDVYTDVNVPYVYDENTGYYTLDTDQWAVYFDGGAASGSTMKIADKPAYYNWNNANVTGFAPFNGLNTRNSANAVKAGFPLNTGSNGKISSYQITGAMNYGLGMTTSVNFKMTEDGRITTIDASGNETEQDIQFNFSGDDDVWVYVDGKLVLDIGGTHDAISGNINFRSGDVTLTSPGYGKVGDYNPAAGATNSIKASLSQENLYTVLDTDLARFAESGMHTLTIYYMDRGQGRTNCKIRFNLPQQDTVTVAKAVSDTKLGENNGSVALTADESAVLASTDYTFTLYKGDAAVSNKTYILNYGNGITETKRTSDTGSFTLKATQYAVFDLSLDGGKNYHVVETNPSTDTYAYTAPEYTYTSNLAVDQASPDTDKWRSNTVSVNGTSTTADSLRFTCTNRLRYKPTVEVDLKDDVVVVDYNLPVDVDVLANDSIYGKNPVYSIVKDGASGSSAFTDENKLKYTMNKVLNEVDSVQYKVTAQDEQQASASREGTATLSVVPASNVYYEDAFATTEDGSVVGITYNGNWTTVPSDAAAVDRTQSAANTVYGSDIAYADDRTYSNATAEAGSNAATAAFTFKGDGVDVYSSTSTDAAYVYAFLYSVDENTNTEKVIQYALVDDYAKSGQYYTVPTVTFQNLEYGTYKVLLRVVAKSATAVNYVLDGIRVYNPLGTVADTSSVAGQAYAQAGELNAVYTEIRSLLLDGSATSEVEDTTGITFIDEADGNYSFADYVNDGPKHEVYLAAKQGIAFRLSNFNADTDCVYVGIKSAMGEEGSVLVTNESASTKAPIQVTSTSDQYYKIIPDENGNVVIVNNGNTVVSLTKVRTTTSVGNKIDFVPVETPALTNFAEARENGYYTSEVFQEEVKEANTEEPSGEVVIDNGDASQGTEADSDAGQNVFQSILKRFFGWIRGRR